MYVTKFGRKFKIDWWKGQTLLNQIALDTETELIASPSDIPFIIISTAYDGGDTIYLIRNNDLNRFLELHEKHEYIFWNAAFDISVLEKQTGFNFHTLLLSKKINDAQLLYRLLSIATLGIEARKYALDFVTEQLQNETLSKDESIRLTFGQFLNNGEVDYKAITEPHLEYAALDPVATYLNYQSIIEQISKLPTGTKLGQQIHLLGDIALAQVYRNGVCINLPYVEKIKNQFEESKQTNADILASYGYIRGQKGNRTVLENILRSLNIPLPLTEKGSLCTQASLLENYKHFPFINAYLDFKGFEKQESFLKLLNKERVHPRYNSLKRTGRSSCTSPNIQQMPRVGGIRECFVAAPEHVFLDCDYSAIELASIASICLKLFGYSKMAKLINEGRDLHYYMASHIYKCSENEITKEQRQFAKIPNFGLVANMGADTFQRHAANNGFVISLDEAVAVKQAFIKAYPEMQKYWKRGYGRDTVITDTGFVRANCSYTEYLNCPMQGKVAEGAKIALYNLIRSGHKVVAFVHDQVIVECHKSKAEQALNEVKKIMIESMQKVIIGVKVDVTGNIETHFTK
jgi:DNA polymerase-1